MPTARAGEGAASAEERMEGPTVAQALAGFERQGFAGAMRAAAGGRVRCLACGARSPAASVAMLGAARVEGPSDPAAEAMVVAVVCPACRREGTMVLGYGPGAPREDAEALAALRDERRR